MRKLKTTKKKKVEVKFETKELEKRFNDLETSDNYLYRQIKKAMDVLYYNPERGSFIPEKNYYKVKKYRRLWKYKDNKLYKYPLGKKNAFRLLYIIKKDEPSIVDIIIEWGPHDMYKDLLFVTPTKFYYFGNKKMKLYKDL